MRLVKGIQCICLLVPDCVVSSSTDERGQIAFLMPAIQGKGCELAQSFASYMTSYGCIQVKVVPARDQEGNPIERMGSR